MVQYGPNESRKNNGCTIGNGVHSLRKTCPCNKQRFFVAFKIDHCHLKKIYIFLIFAQNIDCWYTLEPPRRGGSNENPQFIFWCKNKKTRYTNAYTSFVISKWGSREYSFNGHVFMMF